MAERTVSVAKLETVLSKQFRTKAIRYDDLMAAIADIPTVQSSANWIPVGVRLPKSREHVIVCRKDGRVEQGVYLGVNGWWKVYGTNTKSVTHWMPMPEPPEGN